LKSKNKALKAVDFFCSAGGVTCGFKEAGVNVLGGIDIDAACKETYEKNNKTKFLEADVSNLSKEVLADFFGIKRNQDDLIFVGCSPCQYYSNIKTIKTKSKETRLLLEDFQDFVAYYKPGYIFIENVPGLDRKKDSPLGRFKTFLANEGYKFDEGVLNSKHFGVPQNRRRYVLLANRLDKELKLPLGDIENVKTVRDAIGNYTLFKPIKSGIADDTHFKHSTARLTEINLRRISKTEKDGGDRRNWPEELELECYKNHNGHYDVYGRMFWDKPAPTITTKFVSYSNGRYGHPEQDRAISIREGAVLQSFPIKYKFYSNSQGTTAKMIGNAVPPRLAKSLALSIINSFNG